MRPEEFKESSKWLGIGFAVDRILDKEDEKNKALARQFMIEIQKGKRIAQTLKIGEFGSVQSLEWYCLFLNWSRERYGKELASKVGVKDEITFSKFIDKLIEKMEDLEDPDAIAFWKFVQKYSLDKVSKILYR